MKKTLKKLQVRKSTIVLLGQNNEQLAQGGQLNKAAFTQPAGVTYCNCTLNTCQPTACKCL